MANINLHKDGRQVVLETCGVPFFDPDGRFSGYRGIDRDITERKKAEEALQKSEELLRLEMTRMPIGYIVWDKDFRVVTWNPAAEKIFGFTFDEAKGRHPYEIIVPPEAQPQVDDIWRRLFAGDVSAHSVNENLTKDGRTIICEWTNTPLKQPDGTVLGVMSMIQDITDRKKVEEEIRKLNEELEQRVIMRTADFEKKGLELQESQFALMNIVDDLNNKSEELEQANIKLKDLDRLKSMFIASMSHELRTPLNSIIGFSSILHDGWVGPVNCRTKGKPRYYPEVRQTSS